VILERENYRASSVVFASLHHRLSWSAALTFQQETEGMTLDDRRAILGRVRAALAHESVQSMIEAQAERQKRLRKSKG